MTTVGFSETSQRGSWRFRRAPDAGCPEVAAPAGARLSAEETADETPPENLADLVGQHQSMVWRYLRLLGANDTEADDLMQETFLRVARGAAAGESIRAPVSFLRAIARNLLLGARRSERRHAPTVDWARSVDELAIADPTAFDDIRIDALQQCREQLRGKSRRAIEIHYIEGHSYQAAADELGLRVNGVKALLSRARQALRHCVERRIQGDLEE